MGSATLRRERRFVLAFVSVLAVLAIGGLIAAGAGASGGSKPATLKLPLPAPGQGKVWLVKVKVTVPKGKHVGSLKVTTTNASQLGTCAIDTSDVVAIGPKSSAAQSAVFNVWVFLDHGTCGHAADPHGVAASAPTANETFFGAANQTVAQVTAYGLLDCSELKKQRVRYPDGREDDIDFLRDKVGTGAIFTVKNTVIAFETGAEQQLDATVSSCPGAEQPDSGNQ